MIDFVFETTPFEAFLQEQPAGGSLDAVRFLSLMEGESEEAVEEALLQLELRGIALDVSQFPKTGFHGEAALRLRREAELVKKGDFLRDLEENDPLRLYLEEVAALPVAADAQRMAERFAGGYEQVLPGLTNLMLSTVIEMAKEKVGYGVLLLDLIQEGSLGLWQGILSFRSGHFETHAKWWIGQYLARAIVLQARQLGFGRKMQEAIEDYRAVDERLLSELGRNATLEEIAEAMHISVEECQTVAAMLESARMMNRAKQETQEQEETPEDSQHVEDTALFQSRQRIQEMLENLTQQESKLIALRFGLEGGLPLSPEETGRKLGLTPEEVVAMEAAALAKMRNN